MNGDVLMDRMPQVARRAAEAAFRLQLDQAARHPMHVVRAPFFSSGGSPRQLLTSRRRASDARTLQHAASIARAMFRRSGGTVINADPGRPWRARAICRWRGRGIRSWRPSIGRGWQMQRSSMALYHHTSSNRRVPAGVFWPEMRLCVG
jgi:hypothetical protein